MARTDIPAGVHVTYRQQYRRCGKAGCSRCASGGRGHGPYWYASWKAEGRQHSRYLGAHAPAEVGASGANAPDAPALAPGAAVEPLRVRTLGGFAVWRGTSLIPPEAWASRRAAALFACLLSAPRHRLPREQAIELLWPEVDPAAGATNLRTTIHRLRQILDSPGEGVSHLRTERAVLTLEPGGDASPDGDWLDAAAFARAAELALAGQDATACRAALARYGGDYLPDDPYAAWAEQTRASLRRQLLDLLLHLAGISAGRGYLGEAEDCLRRVLAAEPGHEGAAATLMGLLASSGRRSDALRLYQQLATVLEDELGVAPSAEIAALRARLLAQETAPVAARMPPQQREPPRPTNLPLEMTSFVGRGWEVAAVKEALASSRLVTLTGPGGCGKTRLGMEVAGRLVESYPDGVWLVELAALAGATAGGAPLVPRAVAGALGLVEETGRPVLDTLCGFLRPRHALLVLDNCEHLIAACAELAAYLLQTCSRLQVLATSRERLGVPGEYAYLVPSLTIPDPDHLPDLERLPSYEAVQLFLERAQARRPGLILTDENAAAVAQICARLDGLPLAIELAAARAGVLPVGGIAARLDDRFRLLTGGPRTALPRQQTLRATLDWSYRLLASGEQTLFVQLAVFAGGCTLAGAAAVCGAADERERAVVDGMAALADKGLLRLLDGAGGEARFAMLETIRAYAADRLEASREAEPVHRRHAAYYVALTEEAEAQHTGPQQRLWLERVEEEQDNIRAALRWLLDWGDAEPRLRIAAAMWRFWMLQSRLREGSRWLGEVLARDDEAPLLRAKVLYGAGVLAYRLGEYAQARTLQEAGMALFRACDYAWGIARSLNVLANAALDGDGDDVQARALYHESLRLAREIGDGWLTAVCLGNLGMVALYRRDTEEAQTYYEKSLALRRQEGGAEAIADALINLGRVALEQGDTRRATMLLQEGLRLLRDLGGIPRLLPDGLEALAMAAGLRRQPERAARLWAVAAIMRREMGAPLEGWYRERHSHWLATVRSQASEAAWRAAWTEGGAMTLEQIVQFALGDGAD